MLISCFSSKFCLLLLAPIGGSCLQQLLLGYFSIMILYFLHSFYSNENSVRVTPSSPLIYLFNYLFISLWPHGYLLHGLSSNTIIIYFVAQIVPASATGRSFQLVPMSFSLSNSSIFLALQDVPCFFYVPWSSLGIS